MQIARNKKHENSGLIENTYKIGDKLISLKSGIKRKYSRHKSDPYMITKVNTNGMVAISQGVKYQCMLIINI